MHTAGRVAALALGVGTFAFLFVNGSWRSDNLFLVPDLVLCAALAGAALTPPRWATRALLFTFGLTAGVLGTSVASYAVEGRLGIGSLAGAVVALVFAVLVSGSPAISTGSADRGAATGPPAR